VQTSTKADDTTVLREKKAVLNVGSANSDLLKFNKSVFSYLRMLTTWHCPHSPAAAAAIDQYLLPAGPTAANLHQLVCYCCTMLGHAAILLTGYDCSCFSSQDLLAMT